MLSTELSPKLQSRVAVELKKLLGTNFYELGVVTEIEQPLLREIVDSFRSRGLVKVRHQGDPSSEVITVREKLFYTSFGERPSPSITLWQRLLHYLNPKNPPKLLL